MYYCNKCARKLGFPQTMDECYITCECCDKPAFCNTMPMYKIKEWQRGRSIKNKKEIVLFKIGGSSIDYTIEQESSKIYDILKIFLKLQKKYQIILSIGGGKRADITKMEYKLFKHLPEVKNNILKQFKSDLKNNMEFIRNLLGSENSMCIYDDFSVKKVLNEDKIILISIMPDKLNKENISPLFSDAHTILIAEYFGVRKIGILKRTDSVYNFDPYLGFYGGNKKWVSCQKDNFPYNVICVDSFFKPNCPNRIGAFDKEPHHLFDDTGLRLFKKSNIESISIVHISPYELYIGGKHVVTGKKKPNKPENKYRDNILHSIVKGENKTGVILRKSKEE